VAALFEAGTVAEMAAMMEQGDPQGCIAPIQPEGTKPPFFCVHGAFGQAIGFYGMARYLGPDQPFYGIQSIGWEGTTPPFTKTVDMAAHYVAEMRKVQPHGPYYLGGYSYGGRVAVYLAEMLKQAGEEVALLAILDTAAVSGRRHLGLGPWLARCHPTSVAERLGLVGQYASYRLRKGFDSAYDAMRRAILFPLMEHYRVTDKTVPLFLRRPDRTNDLMRVQHRHMPAYDGDAVYFRTQSDPRSMSHPDTRDQWHRLIKGELTFIDVPGNHLEMIQEPYVKTLAQELEKALASARAKAGE